MFILKARERHIETSSSSSRAKPSTPVNIRNNLINQQFSYIFPRDSLLRKVDLDPSFARSIAHPFLATWTRNLGVFNLLSHQAMEHRAQEQRTIDAEKQIAEYQVWDIECEDGAGEQGEQGSAYEEVRRVTVRAQGGEEDHGERCCDECG